MDVMNNISPYWCADPTLADARLAQASKSLLDTDRADPAVIVGGPDALLPLPTPAAYGAERRRLTSLFQLPFPYLPEEIFRRGVRESVGDWRVRMTITLDMLGGLGFDDDGTPRYGTLDGLPESDELAAAAVGFDGGDPTVYDRTCDRLRETIGRVWPDGYPLEDLKADAHVIHAHCLRGSLVLSAQTAIAVGSMQDGGRRAVAILTRLREEYGPLFDPAGTGPKDVAKWTMEHRSWALDMASMLEDAGLEPKGVRDAMDGVLS